MVDVVGPHDSHVVDLNLAGSHGRYMVDNDLVGQSGQVVSSSPTVGLVLTMMPFMIAGQHHFLHFRLQLSCLLRARQAARCHNSKAAASLSAALGLLLLTVHLELPVSTLASQSLGLDRAIM